MNFIYVTKMFDLHIVEILAPVHIEELQPADQRVVYDDKNFELSCTASGSNINKVTWYKDDQPLDHRYLKVQDLQTVDGKYEYEQTHS